MLTRFRGPELAFGAWHLTAATVAACGGKALNVGSEEQKGVAGTGVGSSPTTGGHPGSGGSGASQSEQPTLSPQDLADTQWPADTPCVASDSPKVGTWKGHWPDLTGGDADVVVRIKGFTGAGVPCGTVTIGNGPAPPPVEDADAIYPPSQGAGGGSATAIGPAIMAPWPGYEYRMLNVQASESRLAFMITYQEILRPWCQLQPAFEESHSCLPAWTSGDGSPSSQGVVCTISGPDLPRTVVPCFKMQYCASYTCFCYDGACDVSLQGTRTAFELHWDGPSLEGTVNQTQLIFLDPVP